MRVAIRADASLQIGTGHIMRCKTLADELRGRGAEIRFICREHPGNLIPLLRDAGYPTAVLPASATAGSIQNAARDDYAVWLGVGQSEDAAQTLEALGDFMPDWLAVDHYGLDVTWERLLRSRVGRIFVIDDLANRPHDCDLLLDQNYYRDLEGRYVGLVNGRCKTLLGPRYTLLRPEFVQERQTLRERDGIVRRIFVCFGGIDLTNETAKAIKALLMLGRTDIEVDVVIGGGYPYRDEIARMCAGAQNFHFYCQASNMAVLMAGADLAIGGGGAITWERCALGLPALVVSLADNQVLIAEAVNCAGALTYVGTTEGVSEDTLAKDIERQMRHPETLLMMSNAGIELVDTFGCKRVWQTMEEWISEDCNTLF